MATLGEHKRLSSLPLFFGRGLSIGKISLPFFSMPSATLHRHLRALSVADVGGGGDGLGLMVVFVLFFSGVHARVLLGVSLLGDALRLRRWHTSTLASSRPRVSF